ncbi:MAG: restriction endonuclease [Pseudomonadota bacterium]
MESGFCLNFSDRTFAAFFHEELGVDIDDPRYGVEGGSKAKRLRYYLKRCDQKTLLTTLNALWDYRQQSGIIHDYADLEPAVVDAYMRLLERLGARPKRSQSTVEPSKSDTKIPDQEAERLAARLIEVSQMSPQERGYAFERFLKDLFDAYGLSAGASYRLTGEQIDGSFELAGETYLLEAKWTNTLVDIGVLRAFNAKVESKSSWTRGLLVSQNGFSPDSLAAFGPGNSLVCMDGFDIHETLSKRYDLAGVISLKARRAAETGKPYVPIRELEEALGRVRDNP